MSDTEIIDLKTRLQQIEGETLLLAAQQQELRRQLQTAQTTRDRCGKTPATSP